MTLPYFFYFFALLLVPVALLLAADALHVTHINLTYIRLFFGALIATVVGGIFYPMDPVLGVGMIFVVTVLWIRLHMDTDWKEAFLMAGFGGLVGGIFLWAVLLLFPSFKPGDTFHEPEPLPVEVLLRKPVHIERSSKECMEIARKEVTPSARFNKLTFGSSATLNGDGLSDDCEVYYLTEDGLMKRVSLKNNELLSHEVESDAELNKTLYQKREDSVLFDSKDILLLLQEDEDFDKLYAAYSEKDLAATMKDLVFFSGIAYDETHSGYVWQVSLGKREAKEGKMTYVFNAKTGEILKKERVQKAASPGDLIYWEKVGGEWVRK